MKNIDEIADVAAENFNGRITGYNAYFYGICESCLQKQKAQ
jgi:Fur family peroxide stress response transcriptional regulator